MGFASLQSTPASDPTTQCGLPSACSLTLGDVTSRTAGVCQMGHLDVCANSGP